MSNNTLNNNDINLIKNIKDIGDSPFKKCFQCGTCSAICPISSDNKPFPRKEMIWSQWGLKNELESDLDPWLCYYCGKCSEYCPRKADPGQLMMSLRRWLTTGYDWTGISKLLYKSKVAEYIALLIVAMVVFLEWAVLFGLTPPHAALNGGNLSINQMVPAYKIDYFFDYPMMVILSVLLISFIFNMFNKTVLSDKKIKIPFKLYFTELWALIFNFFTQIRFSKCEDESEKESFFKKLSEGKYNFWLTHVFLMTSYVVLFIGIVFFLKWFQTDDKYVMFHSILFDYYASIGLIFGTIYFAFQRFTKRKERSKFSHHTDWAFIVLLFLTAFTGILLRAFVVYKDPSSWIFYLYLIHLMILIPMLVVEVPFSKWSHLAYRPMAIYFANLKEKAGSNESN
ncbi:MAG: 4Fe-4S dicluster domain-containing protein [bacterium]